MKENREKIRRDIAEAFDFMRFLIKHPRMLAKIRNGSEIRILPAGVCLQASRASKRVQTFAAETVFRSL
ncbi:MAG: hypothetical protein HZB91_13255 [Elusimicrobia bacterium]|nr:hypothetical protein [Elusimicrobiota bacterium]